MHSFTTACLGTGSVMVTAFCMCFCILREIETDMDMRRGFILVLSRLCSMASSRVFLLFLLLIDKICSRDGESKRRDEMRTGALFVIYWPIASRY